MDVIALNAIAVLLIARLVNIRPDAFVACAHDIGVSYVATVASAALKALGH